MTKIGYIGGSFKPFHAGHFALVQNAAKDCDAVKLYISTADRLREGEIPIKGATMQEIWARYLINSLPENVDVFFTSSPVRSIYEAIGEEDKGEDSETGHVIYSDDSDMQKNYPEKSLKKYFPRLSANSKVEVKPTPRTVTVNISGTAMRKYIQLGLCDDFIAGLPEPVKSYGNEIWKLLGGKAV
jgi:cytidyltransferase-like protein